MKQTVFQLPQVRILGRHVPTDGALTLFYTACGIECLCTGSELWLELNADYAQYEPWLSIELNGAWLSRFPVAPGRSRVCVFRGMTPGTPKRVRVLKDVQAHARRPPAPGADHRPLLGGRRLPAPARPAVPAGICGGQHHQRGGRHRGPAARRTGCRLFSAP